MKLGAIGCCLALLAALPAAAQQVVPVADFFRSPQVAHPVLSPSGRYLAFSMQRPGSRAALMVRDLDDPTVALKAIGYFRDTDVNRVWWVSEHRLVFDSLDRDPGRNDYSGPGLWGVDRDGGNFRALIRSGGGSTMAMLGPAHDGSDDVLALGHEFDSRGELRSVKPYRINTRNGRLQSLVEDAPAHSITWALDGEDRPVAVGSYKDGRYTIRVRRMEGWTILHEGDGLTAPQPQVHAAAATGELYLSKPDGEGVQVLHRLAADAQLESARPLLSLQGHDFSGLLMFGADRTQLLGVHYETDAPGTVWFDPALKAAQQRIDAALPGTVNLLHCNACERMNRLVVTALSDHQAAAYYLYERDTGSLRPLFRSRPWLADRVMGRRDVQRFAARDGLPVPALITWPARSSTAPLPTVILVNGGPWMRGTHWAWEPQAQFLASRGYLVIEPEFRGSTGYGFQHFRAGWKQWGLAMQDDLADAVDWAVKKGWTDPDRVCIAGASYGGYAALMGLVRHHDKYRCAINWVGVTDIDLMYSIHWSDTTDQWKRQGMPLLIGDRANDADQLRAASPVRQADKLRRPVLMAYGLDDPRVPLDHGVAMKDALERHKQAVEWITNPDEGHGWLRLETEIDFWTRVEKFLGRHIGGVAPGR